MWQKGSFHQLQSAPPTSIYALSTFQFGNQTSAPVHRTSASPTAMFTPLSAQQKTPSTTPPRGSDSSDAEMDSLIGKHEDSSDSEEVLVNALDFKTAPGKVPEPLLSMHVSASIRKRFGQISTLLETQPVPDDDKAYEFSCSNKNTNKLSLTTAKPKAKVDSYTSWNKAFRVLMEIVVLKWLDQCLPMVQYTTELCDNIGKFPFPVLYNYDVKFRLKKQSCPYLPWNEIDNRLWTKCFMGVKESNLFSAFQSHKKGDTSRIDT